MGLNVNLVLVGNKGRQYFTRRPQYKIVSEFPPPAVHAVARQQHQQQLQHGSWGHAPGCSRGGVVSRLLGDTWGASIAGGCSVKAVAAQSSSGCGSTVSTNKKCLPVGGTDACDTHVGVCTAAAGRTAVGMAMADGIVNATVHGTIECMHVRVSSSSSCNSLQARINAPHSQ